MSTIRPQMAARSTWDFNPNSMTGLEEAVYNNQQQLAIEYLRRIVHELRDEIETLKAGKTESVSAARTARTKADAE